MNVEKAMATQVFTCQPHHPLSCAADLMWKYDIGSVPIVDEKGLAIAMVTDRDICMACFTNGKAPAEIPVAVAMSREFFSVRPTDSLQTARDLMRKKQIRRLPVVDSTGKLVGMLSLHDLARLSTSGQRDDATVPEAVAATLASVGSPRARLRS